MKSRGHKRAGLERLTRAAAVATLGVAVAGGIALPAAAAEPGQTTGDDVSVPLDPRPGTPDRMQFLTNVEHGVANPGQPVKVAVKWRNWDVWDAFNSQTQLDAVSLKQDVVKLLSWQKAYILLNGDPCATAFPPAKGSAGGKQELLAASEDNPTNFEPVDVGGLVAQVRNLSANAIKSLLGGDNFLTRFLKSEVKSTCSFTVPATQRDDIRVTGDVSLNNLAGLLHSDEIGKTWLKVAAPAAPQAPTIQALNGSVSVTQGGELHGTADPGTNVRLKINGSLFQKPVVKADADGNWTMTLPDTLKPGTYAVQATSQRSTGGPSADSAPVSLAVTSTAPVVKKPVITAPAGDVKAGDQLTVTGSDGSTVTAVDQDGNQVAGPVAVSNGKATLTLPNDLKSATQIKVVAKDANGNQAESDPKNVAELFQSLVPSAAPGKTAYLDVSYEPTDGDVTKVGGRTLVLKAPEGFTFTTNMSYKVFGQKGAGDGVWIGDKVQLSDGGKTATVTLPSAADIQKSYQGTVEAFNFKITAIPTADSTATPGAKTGGTATIDGIGSTPLKGVVNSKA
ncbi:Ig-like domain-containing protein [Kribbella sp.]|uniref:Ig-like domain-containing protein n=1 Tax=Kribbella sp. TaxID=1871183 RepID=UPI002D3CEEEF|nr:Ig-like domain-containing protein [Kribbella sp.]HZX02122.1 Ig-like domain-containing protein [Kribbella sp.]